MLPNKILYMFIFGVRVAKYSNTHSKCGNDNTKSKHGNIRGRILSVISDMWFLLALGGVVFTV